MDNLIHVADSLHKSRWRSPRESLRVQADDGGNNLRREDKLTADIADNVVKLADVHDFAAQADRRDGKTFIAA